MQKMKTTAETISLRAAPSAYGIAAAIFGVPLLITLAAAVRQPVMWVPVMMCGAAILVCWLWLRKYLVELNGEGVRCEELLRPTVTIRFSEIDRVSVEGRPMSREDKTRPAARLVIQPTLASAKPALVIRMKVFRLHEFQRFLTALEGKTRLSGGSPS